MKVKVNRAGKSKPPVDKSALLEKLQDPKAEYRPVEDKQLTVRRLDFTYNDPYVFSMSDFARNQCRIDMLRTRFDDMIRRRGVDLLYFRKFNTFFQNDQNNHANMIYGQDTTAQYYVSGVVRAFLDVKKQDFTFSLMGYQAQEQFQIWMTIQDFRSRFATWCGQTRTEMFMVPVTGDLQNMDFYGRMDVPEFSAVISGSLDKDLWAVAAPEICSRPVNSRFFNTLYRQGYLQPLSGWLQGRLQPNPDSPGTCSGYLQGPLTYSSFQNIEKSPTWDIAPQVGDYFKLKTPEIQQDFEINKVMDKQMGRDGLNPLLGRYLYKCHAVRRTPSQQRHDIRNAEPEPGDGINRLLEAEGLFKGAEPPQNFPEYQKKKRKTGQRKNNLRTNKIAKGIYDYSQDNLDDVYGGYDENIPSSQKPRLHTTTDQN